MFNALKLQWKILLVLAVLSVVPLLLNSLVLSRMTRNLIRSDMERIALAAGNFVESHLDASRVEQSNYISLLAGGNDLVNACYYASLTGDTEQAGELLTAARGAYDFDILELLGPDGTTFFKTQRDDLGDTASLPTSHPLIAASRAGKPTSTIDIYSDRLSLIVVAPVVLQDEAVAYLLGVTLLDDAFASRIRSASGAEVAFHDGERTVAASSPELVDLSWTSLPDFTSFDLGGAPHSVFSRQLGDGKYGMVLAIDRSAQVSADKSAMAVILTILAASAALAVLIGLAFSRRLVMPLKAVVATLKEIAEGEADLTRTLPVTSHDEVGELAESFNRFVARLRIIVSRSQEVTRDLFIATEKIDRSSSDVNEGATLQARSLEESYRAIAEIDRAAAGVADNVTDLLAAAEESSSATLQLGATNAEIADQMERLFNNVEEVSSSINEMSVSSQQIADNIGVLSLSTEATASSILELDSSIKSIEERAEQTKTLAEEASHDAEMGKASVDETIADIESARQIVDQATTAIVELGRQSDQIGKILTVIDEVADQTGLLSLNAAIIAAQAGDRGRSFAVVATEIRELADRTAASTKEIAAIIDNLQRGTREAVETMQNGSKRVHQVAERSKSAGDALEKIRTSTANATQQVRAIVRSTQEQTNGSRQITAAVEQITTLLSQIETAVRQQTGGTQQLSRVSEAMHEIAAHVKRSTVEQARGSNQIAQNLEQVRQMVARINEATEAQTDRSREVVKGVSEVRDIAEQNSRRTEELDQVLEGLGRMAADLEREIGSFRAAGQD